MQAIREFKISERNLLQQCFYQLIGFVQATTKNAEKSTEAHLSQLLKFSDEDILLLIEALRQLDCRDGDEQEIKRNVTCVD